MKQEKKSTAPKKRAIKTGKPVMLRLQDDPLDAINEWRRAQPDLPNLSEAIRRLTAAGLEAEAQKKKGKK